MGYRFLAARRDGPVEHLTLNRPEARNAFNEEVVAELTGWASAVEADARSGRVRAAVVSGAGAAFCAGADVGGMARTIDATEAENLRDAAAMGRMFAALDRLSVPLIGRVHGAALGGGCGLVAVCDLVAAERDTLFGFTEVKLGILPAVIAPVAIAKIGRSAARALFLTGSRFSAARAEAIGLVHAVVVSDELDRTVAGWVREVLTAGPEAVGAAKALIREVWNRSLDEALPLTTREIAARRISAEGQEGLRAFLEKRKPSWSL